MNHKASKLITDTLIAITIGIAIAVSFQALFHPYIVDGISMEPTYTNGQIVLTEAVHEDVEAGDVVVVTKNPFYKVIKRIVALPGDTIEVADDGFLYVNGELSPYNYEAIEDAGMIKEPYTLSEDEYFYIGDNRNNSTDSRQNGPVSINNIKYKVTKVLQF